MNERLKQLRTSLGLSQEEFGKRINLSKPTISALENATRCPTDRVVYDICRQFGANENWLRTGEGAMLCQTDKTVLSLLEQEFDLDALDLKIIDCYLKMDASKRKVMKDYLYSLVDAVLSEDDRFREQCRKKYEKDTVSRPVESDQKSDVHGLLEDRNVL